MTSAVSACDIAAAAACDLMFDFFAGGTVGGKRELEFGKKNLNSKKK